LRLFFYSHKSTKKNANRKIFQPPISQAKAESHKAERQRDSDNSDNSDSQNPRPILNGKNQK
jgi:hypothetical protein